MMSARRVVRVTDSPLREADEEARALPAPRRSSTSLIADDLDKRRSEQGVKGGRRSVEFAELEMRRPWVGQGRAGE